MPGIIASMGIAMKLYIAFLLLIGIGELVYLVLEWRESKRKKADEDAPEA